MTKNIVLLGSTGSIGRQTLEIARNLNIRVIALSAHKNADL
jgi:1-deoxy-D-xylulose-5-phosphate reductoisomerase